ncbi:MAG: tRNA (N(6)-L-threonylcarbamoyladenosine(37)-C(2))-methylthiotransferase MtaB [Chitinophagaceae bacterium]|nr:tRNA (N(6)-L-threonylcarbamoyladenosine(37)-C(2))-methylthiotransferase MtaB [Chitinophagaceae bacterium]
MKKITFYTLGCKLNYSETSTISQMFQKKGYTVVPFHETPDIFIINTCSVTENADKKCKKIVQESKKISPHALVAIIGCYAQLKPKEISEIPGVDMVLGASEKFNLVEHIEQTTQKELFKFQANTKIDTITQYHSAYSTGDRTRSFLKVQDGCNYKCTFCTIPNARGKSRSGTIDNIFSLAKSIGEQNIKEIVLTGVNIGDFGIQEGRRKETFFNLIQKLDTVENVSRFRISSIEPNLLTEEIIHFIAQSEKFVPHFHIPLQSGSDTILESMKRRYRKDMYEKKIHSIKKQMPHCCVGIDVIVGFPGETEELFLETYSFLKNIDCSYLHVFTYSERDNTPAQTFHGIVNKKERQERSHILRELSDNKKKQFYQKNLKKNYTVLFENDIENGKMHGFTENYIRVNTPYDPLLINELRKVELLDITQNGTVTAREI